MAFRKIIPGLLVPFLFVPAAPAASKDQMTVYVGTYTGKKSKGIHAFRLDAAAGKMTPLGVAGETSNPSFLAIHPNRKFLYAVGEVAKEGSLSAFAIDPETRLLKLLNSSSTKGPGPCHVSIDKTGRNALVANYSGGSVAVIPIKEDGSLGPASAFVQHSGSGADPRRQKGPHAHSINLSPDNRFAVAADLGLDKLLVYRFDAAKGSLEPNDPPFAATPPASGPRHFTFHPNGKYGYAINEMGNTVTAFSWNASRGAFTEIETVTTLPGDWKGTSYTAEVQAHPNGKFLYGSNRGHDSIVVFSIDGQGKLKQVQHVPTQGKFPRNFGIDPTGRILIAANQNSDNIVVYRIDQKSGRLTPTGETFEVGAPVCIKFLR